MVSRSAWNGFALEEQPDPQGEHAPEEIAAATTQRLLHLLQEPSLLQGHFATKLQPLLQRLIEKRLSSEARTLLNVLALCNVPLGKPALQVLCSRPAFLKELRDASLLVTYPHRAQLLPMVASAVRQQLSPDQTHELEKQLIDALTCWLDEGSIHKSEQGAFITELAILLLKHQQFLEAAQLLTCYGWMSFNLGQAFRLAQHLSDIKQTFNWQAINDNKYGDLLLNYLLSPYLGKSIDAEKRVADHRYIYEAAITGKVMIWPGVDIAVTHELMLYQLNRLHFDEAQTLLKDCMRRLSSVLPSRGDLHISLLEKQAWVYTRMCEYDEEQKETYKAREKREQIILLYKQCIARLLTDETFSLLDNATFKRRLARDLNDLGYHLNRIGRLSRCNVVPIQDIYPHKKRCGFISSIVVVSIFVSAELTKQSNYFETLYLIFIRGGECIRCSRKKLLWRLSDYVSSLKSLH